MTAVDEIRAAIEKLTDQRELATEGPWYPWHPQNGQGNSSVDAATHDPDNSELVVEGGRPDVDLIVTLHRTIDAQLAILRNGLQFTLRSYEYVHEHSLALARAINGTVRS